MFLSITLASAEDRERFKADNHASTGSKRRQIEIEKDTYALNFGVMGGKRWIGFGARGLP